MINAPWTHELAGAEQRPIVALAVALWKGVLSAAAQSSAAREGGYWMQW